MLKIYLIIASIFVPNLIFSMEEKIESKLEIPKTLKDWSKLPAEMQCKVLDFSDLFAGVIDPLKTVQQNIKALFKKRNDLALINKDFKQLIMETCRPEVLKAIGRELSKIFPSDLQSFGSLGKLLAFQQAIDDYSKDPDVIKALAYVKSDNGMTLLHWVAVHGQFKRLKILVEAGADVNADFEGTLPIDVVTGSNPDEIRQYLIKHGSKPRKKLS